MGHRIGSRCPHNILGDRRDLLFLQCYSEARKVRFSTTITENVLIVVNVAKRVLIREITPGQNDIDTIEFFVRIYRAHFGRSGWR